MRSYVGDFVKGTLRYLGDFSGRIDDESWLVALASMRDGRKVRRIGFKDDSL